MRMAGLAMLVALGAGGASAQTVSKPSKPKLQVTQPAQDAVKTPVSPVGAEMNRTISALPGDITSEAQKETRDDRDLASEQKASSTATPVKPCKDCLKTGKPH